MTILFRLRMWLLIILVSTISTLSGCAMVQMKSLETSDFIAMKRGDVLTTGSPSRASLETLQILGFNEDDCRNDIDACFSAISQSSGLNNERRLGTLSELWLQRAIEMTPRNQPPRSDEALSAYLEASRHAYAYLFFSERTPGQRAFEDRQTQVRDYYNYAVQQTLTGLFTRYQQPTQSSVVLMKDSVQVGEWLIKRDMSGIRVGREEEMPLEILAASSLRFPGLRNIYRRDGFGAELVAVMDRPLSPYLLSEDDIGYKKSVTPPRVFSEMSTVSVSALLHFDGNNLEQVLSTRRLILIGYDPYITSSVHIQGHDVPLAANFTAGYGVWLARSNFATQSLRTLLGRSQGISRPHIYMMQPYDPDRRVILMLHGLASSPEAWVNVANEVSGDELLRKHYQVWQVYYPTNIPIGINHQAIRNVLTQTLQYVDPKGATPASHNMVLVGHSMGGVIARLMVSSSMQEHLSEEIFRDSVLSPEHVARIRERLTDILYFEPMPEMSRVIFIATPHSGTPIASNRIVRWISNLIKLPDTLLRKFDDVLYELPPESRSQNPRIPNSIDNLRDTDPFIRAAATLPIAPYLPYHSIIARRGTKAPLIDSDDGVVPYRSAHLPTALSEKIIISGHSVQDTPQAILEIRRILRLDLEKTETRGN